MRIAIDGTAIGPERSGARTRLVNLLRAYAALPRRHDVVLLARGDAQLEEILAPLGIECVASAPPRSPFARWREPRTALLSRLDAVRADALQAESLPVPCDPGRPLLLTIHDLRDLFPPTPLVSPRRAYLRLVLPRALRRVARVIAVSEFTRGALISRAGAEPDRVMVVRNAPDPDAERVTDPAHLAATRERLRLPRRFVLAFGHLERRKNLGVLAAAMHRVSRDVGLVIAGADREGLGAALVHDAPPGLVLTGAVSDVDRACLLSLADCLAIPSLHEGFGIVPLEAMVAGCPVVAADSGALPEVCGDGALWFHPQDADELAARIAEVVGDAEVARKLKARGVARAARFTWESAARELLAVHDEVAERDAPPASNSGAP